MFPKRLYLTTMAADYIRGEFKEKFRSQHAFAEKVFPEIEPRNLTNWLNNANTINQRELQILCNYFEISLEKLTGEFFDGFYLCLADSNRIKKIIKEEKRSFAEIDKNLAIDTATLKNWIYRYSSIDCNSYAALLKELNVEKTMVLDKLLQEISAEDAILEKQFEISQQIRAFLLGSAKAVKPQTLEQKAIDAIVRQLNIPEKEVRIFHHDASVQKNFYAKILIYGKTGRYIFTFFTGWQPVDYGEVIITARFVTAKHLFSGITFTSKKPETVAAKVATWFGEGSCLFAIRSIEPFQITVQSQDNLAEQEALKDEEMVVFLC